MNVKAQAAWEKFRPTPHQKDDRYHAFMAGWNAGITAALELQRPKKGSLELPAERMSHLSMQEVRAFRSVRPENVHE